MMELVKLVKNQLQLIMILFVIRIHVLTLDVLYLPVLMPHPLIIILLVLLIRALIITVAKHVMRLALLTMILFVVHIL
jgi:hypothetical protein